MSKFKSFSQYVNEYVKRIVAFFEVVAVKTDFTQLYIPVAELAAENS